MFLSEMAATPLSSTASFPLAGLSGQARQSFLQSLSQHRRLISIDTPLAADALIVESFTGREVMSGLFRFDVDCLATSAHVELKALISGEVSLRLQLAEGGTRAFHGMVSEASQLGSDGSLTAYRLTLVPWLHKLTLRRDSYVFQDKTVLEILENIFKDYPNASYRFDVQVALPQRSVAIQYRESDYDFCARLLAEEGLNFFFEHDDDDADTATDARTPHVRHRLVVFDDNASLPACSQPTIRFHRADATESTDAVTLFTQQRQIHSNALALGSWDYKTLATTAAEVPARPETGAVPSLEVYEGAGAYRYTDMAESARIARARMESLDLVRQILRAESSARQLAVGAWFTLTGHPDADGDYVALTIEHCGANNLASGAVDPAQHPGIERGTYRNQFTCVPRATPIRPPYWFPKPTAPGLQVGLVVGVANEEITTERDHRVKIQFPWQRGDHAAPGQLRHPAASNAPGDDTAGAWVRVAEPVAGANWGAAFIARIGQEVCIDFIGGDIDRPVVTGQLYNGADPPPFHGADNHAGALAGIKSKEYAAGGFNQWVIDDTPGQLRQGMASTYAASQLNTGYLIRQNGNMRGAYRGMGFELATDAWSTLRARRGVFLSTAQRSGAVSTQLDTQEAQGKLKAADALAKTLSDAAVLHQALPLTASQGLRQLNTIIAGKDSADGQQAPRLEQPITLIDSQAGVNTATPASSVWLAGQDITMTAASAMRVTGGQTVSLAAARAASLFTHAGGAKVIAAKEPVSVRAHTGPMDVLADQAITVTSSNGSIKVRAKQEIMLASGGGYIKLNGGNIDIHCPSSVSVKGATHDFLGAGSKVASLPKLPDTRARLFDEAFVVKDENTGLPIANHPYRIKRADGTYEYGQTDFDGRTHIVSTTNLESLIVEVL